MGSSADLALPVPKRKKPLAGLPRGCGTTHSKRFPVLLWERATSGDNGRPRETKRSARPEVVSDPATRDIVVAVCRRAELSLNDRRIDVFGAAATAAPAHPTASPAAITASTLAFDSGRTALRAQSRSFAPNRASISGFSGDPSTPAIPAFPCTKAVATWKGWVGQPAPPAIALPFVPLL
jgi:hypothetical protein